MEPFDPKRRTLVLLAPSLALGALGCSKPKAIDCEDVSQLSASELALREQLQYRSRPPKPELTCDRCIHYVEGEDPTCGACRVMPGPTAAQGYCKVFAPRG